MVKYDDDRLNQTFSALADPTRRKILEALREDECAVGEVVQHFDMSWPAVSKHLRILEEAGLLERKKVGRIHHLRLKTECLAEVTQWVEIHRACWDRVLEDDKRSAGKI